MTLRIRLLLFALAASLPALAHAQSVSDFSLEPVPTPTATAQAQGPADTRSGVEIRPRAVNTPTPTPTPRPTATATATVDEPLSSPLPTPRATAPSQPGPSVVPPTLAPQSRPSPSEPFAAETSEPVSVDPPESADPGLRVPSEASGSVPEAPAGEAEAPFPWLWTIAIAALAVLFGAGAAFWRRRAANGVPQIERPAVASAAKRSAPLDASQAISLRVETDKLIRSAAFATLKYRLTLVNRTDTPLTSMAVGVDLVSAHARVPMEQQVATENTTLETRHRIERLGPRQSMTLDGQVQLPLGQAQIVMQGRHPLLVPLMRFRIDGAGERALVKTFVVGQGVPGVGRVQPFRLDEPPRSYAPIAQRELA